MPEPSTKAARLTRACSLPRDSHRLAESVTHLFASLRESLARSTECTRQHLELYRDTRCVWQWSLLSM